MCVHYISTPLLLFFFAPRFCAPNIRRLWKARRYQGTYERYSDVRQATLSVVSAASQFCWQPWKQVVHSAKIPSASLVTVVRNYSHIGVGVLRGYYSRAAFISLWNPDGAAIISDLGQRLFEGGVYSKKYGTLNFFSGIYTDINLIFSERPNTRDIAVCAPHTNARGTIYFSRVQTYSRNTQNFIQRKISTVTVTTCVCFKTTPHHYSLHHQWMPYFSTSTLLPCMLTTTHAWTINESNLPKKRPTWCYVKSCMHISCMQFSVDRIDITSNCSQGVMK